jgi:hypothetical protein
MISDGGVEFLNKNIQSSCLVRRRMKIVFFVVLLLKKKSLFVHRNPITDNLTAIGNKRFECLIVCDILTLKF